MWTPTVEETGAQHFDERQLVGTHALQHLIKNKMSVALHCFILWIMLVNISLLYEFKFFETYSWPNITIDQLSMQQNVVFNNFSFDRMSWKRKEAMLEWPA